VAEEFFRQKGVPAEMIKLNGSVELAPLIGMADVIVDIVETGNTLYENGLVILEDIHPISTGLIVNKASFATKTNTIRKFIDKLESVLE
jgi:ATP phosphoribosyltransferase